LSYPLLTAGLHPALVISAFLFPVARLRVSVYKKNDSPGHFRSSWEKGFLVFQKTPSPASHGIRLLLISTGFFLRQWRGWLRLLRKKPILALLKRE
jgi:hypothetical protein